MQLSDAFVRQWNAVPARHKELSVISSLDDEGARPSERLLDVAADAFRRARTMRLPIFDGRNSPEPRWFDTWPGEHYRLLPAMVETLQATTVVEIGTFTGMGTLALRQALPPGGRLVTFDLIPWQHFGDTWLRPDDFADGQVEQRLADISTEEGMAPHRALLESADFIFFDGPKDGVTESALLQQLASLQLKPDLVVFFDDIRVINMVDPWRRITRPKMDITSFGHWSGSGIVDWNG